MGIVKRSDKLAFYGIQGESDAVTYHRMKNFTDISISKNAKEYSRQYVDVDYEDTDVVGYAPSISYGFDEYENDPVHTDIAAICDGELVGGAAVRSILFVDLTKEGTPAGSFQAKIRDFAVIPDTEGDSTDAYTYSGTMKAKGASVFGTATTTNEWETCTFTAKGSEA